ncbi:serine/threonine protein kinase [Gordonia sp. ABSL49_1]|uniref:serine/threonine protein kinase n=1 Tax=unclassified Gordonia (in: high G+C Gram-positive bacteria) TaxID=2657482 RepID=UPI001F0FCC42|nr:serine/threonine protein kinase [Gordonia sp. ABSL49_1]MCH5641942.1 serine/threonine protein kinase [Gordonia sp. ABSL49_1]
MNISGTVPPGTTVSGHRIEAVLRADPGGVTYLATNPSHPEPVDLTLIRPDLSADPDFRRRLERAIDVATRLRHPNLAEVLGRGSDNAQLWVAARHLDGISAAERLRSGPNAFDEETAVAIVTDIGKGLDSAHRKGLVLRNISPATIILVPAEAGQQTAAPRAVLTGFALSRTADDARYHPANDVHMLAYVLLELLTGTPPSPNEPLSESISPTLRSAIDRALGADKNVRYRTCAEFTRAAELAVTLSRPEAAQPPPSGDFPSGSPVPPSSSATRAAQVADAQRSQPAPASVEATTQAIDQPTTRLRRLFTPRANPESDTEVVTDRRAALGQADASHHPQPRNASRSGSAVRAKSAHNRRMPPVVVPIVSVLVIVGVVIGTLAYLGARNGGDKWSSAAAPIADTFPDLLPSRPAENGWGDSGCKEITNGDVPGISCINPNNLTFVVWHTATMAGRSVVTADLPKRPGQPHRWDEGPVFASPDTVPHGWTITNFNDDPRRPYTIVATWPGHTGQQVLDDWWQTAPFGT